MSSKTALVTGGTAGVGLAIARALARQDYSVWFVGRSREKGTAAEAELADVGTGRCTFVELDLSDLSAVLDFATRFKTEVPELHLLVNVAGVMLARRKPTSAGLETTFTVGYLSALLLCRELVEPLSKVPNSRIANVSGDPSHIIKARLDFDDLGFSRSYGGMRAAIKTVHAKTVLTQILAEPLRGEGIDVNAFHPGTVRSDLGRELAFPLNVLLRFAGLFMSRECKSGTYVCTSPDVTGVTGQLFVGTKATPLDFDQAYRDKLWEVSEQVLPEALRA